MPLPLPSFHSTRVRLVAIAALVGAWTVHAQRLMEHLDRGVVAVRSGASEVFVSWRLLGTEPGDLRFDVYRQSAGEATPVRLNASPLAGATHFVDTTANLAVANTYTVVPAGAPASGTGATLSADAAVRQYLSVALQPPAGGTTPDGVAYTYRANDASVGDLDGDGDYEIVLKWDPTNSKDNSQAGFTGNVFLDAYQIDGARLWRIDLGRNIRAGAHYTQFIVYDLDGDGRAEVACKTAPGTIDGTGQPVLLPGNDAQADYRNANGYVLAGPEYLTIFNGLTGAALATKSYVPARGSVASWGDSYGNRVDRFLACVAYLDGVRPSLVMCRGYYTRTVLAAWDWRNGQLTQRWVFDSDDGTPGNIAYRGEGNHNLSVADVDADGRDEIVYGACTIDDNGAGLYQTDLLHGDAMHVSDLDPSRPGLEVWSCHEDWEHNGSRGLTLRSARTGDVHFSVTNTTDTGRAVAIDIDPRYPGAEVWGATEWLYAASGAIIPVARPSSMNHAVWWDGDLLREIFDGRNNDGGSTGAPFVDKWNWETGTTTRLLSADGCHVNNFTKANPCLTADILGDWREEIVLRSAESSELRIYTTTTPTTYRLPTLMHDPQYRLAIAWQNVAYNQPPHPGFFLGDGMPVAPVADIATTAPLNADARLTNLSVLTNGGTGADTLILGFVVEGASAQEMLIRGSGPALADFGVSGVMSDPRLDLYQNIGGTETLLANNDDWSSAGNAAAVASTSATLGAFELPNPSKDAALLYNIQTGVYTAQVSPMTGSAGNALAEIYAVPGGGSRLTNASTRASIGGNVQTLITGFTVSGSEAITVLVRAAGPTLGDLGVGGALANPILRVLRQLPDGGTDVVAINDDWEFVSGASAVTFERLGAFPFSERSKDAALLVRLSPGGYTAHVTSGTGAAGVALIEIYEDPAAH